MYKIRLKSLREENDLKQEEISLKLSCNRSTYANWENGEFVIPLYMADKLTIIYNVSLAYLLGLSTENIINYSQKELDYVCLLNNLNKLKLKNTHTYKYIGDKIKVNKSSCYRYFKGLIEIPTDKLIMLCELYSIDIDETTGKKC